MKRESVPIRNKRGTHILPTYKGSNFTVFPCILPDKQGTLRTRSKMHPQSLLRARPFKRQSHKGSFLLPRWRIHHRKICHFLFIPVLAHFW